VVKKLRIAILEDDPDQAKLVMLWLEGAGHHSQLYETGRALINGIVNESYDLLILDWVLPDMSGDKVLVWLRENLNWRLPVLFTTVRDDECDIVKALESGADDYMVKPLRQLELLARINVIGRRQQVDDTQLKILDCPPYELDPASRVITYHDEVIDMTHKEFDLALFLFRNIGRILSRGHILESVWGRSPDLNTRTVDTHVSRLRNKLKFSDDVRWRLSAIYQHGYRLESLNPANNEKRSKAS